MLVLYKCLSIIKCVIALFEYITKWANDSATLECSTCNTCWTGLLHINNKLANVTYFLFLFSINFLLTELL